MLRLLFTLAFVLLGVGALMAQTGELSGKITDENGEGLPFANVALEKNGVLITGSSTDFDGYFTIKPIDPGSYDVKVSALGYGSKLIQGVRISSDKITTLDETMNVESELIEGVEIVAYKVPLIDKDDNSTKSTITAEEIKSLPTRNVQSIASTSAGVYQADEGKGVSIKGARESGTEYYIDGIRVRGSTNLPANAIEQLTVITGGVPARYGDATGGIINIVTRGPSRSLNGSVDVITSQFLDKYGYNLANFSLTGPIWTKYKGTDSADTKIGFFLAGEFLYHKDPDASAVGVWVAKDDVLQNLQENPVYANPVQYGAVLNEATRLTADDLKNVPVKPNTARFNYSGAGKLDFKVTDNINFTVGGQVNYAEYNRWIARYTLLNSQNNPLDKDLSYRTYARFTQRFGSRSGTAEEGEKKSAFQNAYYSIQFDYSKVDNTEEDEDLGFNAFDYGYWGKYQETYSPTYQYSNGDNLLGLNGYEQTNDASTLVQFTPSDVNPITANFVKTFFDLAGDDQSLYSSLDNISLNGSLRNGDGVANAYNVWYNVGDPFSGYSRINRDQFRLSFNGSVDILPPGASTRNKHSLEFGFEFEQRIDRYYQVQNALDLWSLMRQNANAHLSDLDTDRPTLLIDGVRYEWDDDCQCNPDAPAFGANDTILYNTFYNAEGQTYFDKQLRQALGEPVDGTDKIYVDALDPSIFTLDMFTADNLLRNGGNTAIVNYSGYDYTGKKLNSQPSFNDFFTKKDENGNYTRDIGAFRPIYTAAYIQDKFNFKDLLFNVGVRIDRYDANQKVLKDPYSLYDILSVDEAVAITGNNIDNDIIPGNIGGDYAVYVDDFNSDAPNIIGFRKGDNWYSAAGEEVSDPRILVQGAGSGAQINPYLNPNTVNNIKSESYDPNSSFEDYKPQVTVMPRVAFSFNLTDEASFFAHYDLLSQRPQSRLQATPDQWYFFNENISSTINNPNLKPEQTIDYQVGFRQLVSKNSAITISAFYRELRNMLQVVNITNAYPQSYLTFGNVDFGTVKGFSISYDFRKTKTNNLSFKLNYTLQFADGTGSSETSQSSLVSAGQANLRTISPLSYDSRHQINITADYSFGSGRDYNGPTIKGKKFLSDFGVNLIVRARSGEPYTQQSNATPEGQFGVPTRPILEGSLAGSRLPWNFKVDFKVSKSFAFNTKGKNGGDAGRPLTLGINLWIQNLLNTQNIISVYPYTGNPDDDGYLTSTSGRQITESQVSPKSFTDLYQAWINNPNNYSLPRFIRLGLSFTF